MTEVKARTESILAWRPGAILSMWMFRGGTHNRPIEKRLSMADFRPRLGDLPKRHRGKDLDVRDTQAPDMRYN